MDKQSLRYTGKHQYDWREEFRARTDRALAENDTAPIDPKPVLQAEQRVFAFDALMNDATLDGLMQIAPHFLPLRNFRILDLGCGFGRHAPFFSMFDCLEYVGIDATEGRIAYAKQRYACPRVSFQTIDASVYRTDEPFDVVWCCTVMQHIPTPAKKQIMDTIKAVLKPDGFALIREGRVLAANHELLKGRTLDDYYEQSCPPNMIPVDEAMMVEWARPWKLAAWSPPIFVMSPQ